MCVLNLPLSTIHTIYTQRGRILKAAKVTIGPASSKVVSISEHPVTDRMENLLLSGLLGIQSGVCIISFLLL